MTKLNIVISTLLSSLSITCYAATVSPDIIHKLSMDGVKIASISNEKLDTIRGGGGGFFPGPYIPTPSTPTPGWNLQPSPGFIPGTQQASTNYTEYQVTWFGWGSQQDYRSFAYKGSSTTPGGQNGTTGVKWLADVQSKNAQTWNRSGAIAIEYQLVTNGKSISGNYWNRPAGTTSW